MRALRIDGIRETTSGELLCGRGEGKISYINIDSRDVKGDTLFTPLVDEKVDTHRFLEPVIATSIKVVSTAEALTEAQHEATAETGTAVTHVVGTLIVLQALAGWLRGRLSLPLAGVAGSVDKTITREIIATALSTKYRVFKTKTNHDSQIGIPLTLLDIEGEEIGVIEVGTSRPGGVCIISEFVHPTAAVVTNIGTAHLMEFGSRENVRGGKLRIQDDMREDTLLLWNAGDAMLLSGQVRGGITTCTYGLAEGTDYRTENVGLVNDCAEFTADVRGKRAAVKLGVPDEHQVLDALAALGIAEACGVPLAGAAAELERSGGYRHHQRISERGGVLVIDDSYDANPASMRAALLILHEMGNRRRIAVLGDMEELGETEKELHRETGARLTAAKGAECLYTLDDLAAELAAACRECCGAGYRPELRCFLDQESLFAALKETVEPGDAFLFKASNSMRFSELVDYFSGQGGQETH